MIPRIPRPLLIASVLSTLAPHGAAQQTNARQPIDFNRDVRPILAGRCFTCHGPDEAQRKADLRLDTRDGQRADLDGHQAVVPGRPAASELLARVRATGKQRMPPASTGEALSEADIATLERWIVEGATFTEHWSFVPPQRPAIPAVANANWPTNPIDHFVARRHAREGLTPAPEADRATLLRRVAFDLTGLPPTADAIAGFLNDEQPGAYERAVDRLLADPAYGEHLARHWLDLARYADSAGYADDPKRTIWAYRDWVIRAFNANLPYDEFTLHQLAGDLLPEPTADQRIATAFHRNTMTNSEGGTDDEEFRSVAVVDRVNTTMSVWMGTTMACAQCHDHKYDPLSQEEYLKIFAFFNNTEDSDKRDERPTLPIFTPEQQRDREAWQNELDRLRAATQRDTGAVQAERQRWDDAFPRNAAWRKTGIYPGEQPGAFGIAADLDEVTALRLAATKASSLAIRAAPRGGRAPAARHVRITLLSNAQFLSLAEVQVFAGDTNLARQGKTKQSSTGFSGPSRLAIDGNTDGNVRRAKSTTHTLKEANPWWELDLGSMQRIERVVVWNRTDGVGDRLKNFRIELLDTRRQPVWSTLVKPSPTPSVEVSPMGLRTIESTLLPIGPHTIAILRSPVDLRDVRLELDLPRMQAVSATDAGFAPYRGLPRGILTILATAPEQRSTAQTTALHAHFRTIAEAHASARARIASLEKKLAALRPRTTVPVFRELPPGKRRKTHIHIRGNFLSRGKEVTPGVPAALHPLHTDGEPTRLDLAKWILHPDNPLTARVTVNRFWEMLFGRGLVATSEDFGARSDLPTHPELLDWLACEFVTSGWDVKQLLRRIVTSATYRQDSQASEALRRRDPTNRRLARGPRLRLTAEMIRDQSLALSGLLSRKMFGPPVRPPRPNLGLRAAFGGSTDWRDSTGEDRYRRGIYTFWQRSIPYPSMATFDAPSREVCTVRREPTNTPLQALVTLNDPAFVEAAQALARRILLEGGTTDAARATFGFRRCLVRAPTPAEVQRLIALVHETREQLATTPGDAQALATDPLGALPAGIDTLDAAAWTVAANVLLNLDEVMVKR